MSAGVFLISIKTSCIPLKGFNLFATVVLKWSLMAETIIVNCLTVFSFFFSLFIFYTFGPVIEACEKVD